MKTYSSPSSSFNKIEQLLDAPSQRCSLCQLHCLPRSLTPLLEGGQHILGGRELGSGHGDLLGVQVASDLLHAWNRGAWCRVEVRSAEIGLRGRARALLCVMRAAGCGRSRRGGAGRASRRRRTVHLLENARAGAGAAAARHLHVEHDRVLRRREPAAGGRCANRNRCHRLMGVDGGWVGEKRGGGAAAAELVVMANGRSSTYTLSSHCVGRGSSPAIDGNVARVGLAGVLGRRCGRWRGGVHDSRSR